MSSGWACGAELVCQTMKEGREAGWHPMGCLLLLEQNVCGGGSQLRKRVRQLHHKNLCGLRARLGSLFWGGHREGRLDRRTPNRSYSLPDCS